MHCMAGLEAVSRTTTDRRLDGPLPEGGFGTFSSEGGVPFPGLIRDGAVIDLRPTFGADCTTRQLVERWEAIRPTLRELGSGPGSEPLAPQGLTVHPPIEPRQVLCAGANYFEHVREMAYDMARRAGDERPDAQSARTPGGPPTSSRSAIHSSSPGCRARWWALTMTSSCTGRATSTTGSSSWPS